MKRVELLMKVSPLLRLYLAGVVGAVLDRGGEVGGGLTPACLYLAGLLEQCLIVV